MSADTVSWWISIIRGIDTTTQVEGTQKSMCINPIEHMLFYVPSTCVVVSIPLTIDIHQLTVSVYINTSGYFLPCLRFWCRFPFDAFEFGLAVGEPEPPAQIILTKKNYEGRQAFTFIQLRPCEQQASAEGYESPHGFLSPPQAVSKLLGGQSCTHIIHFQSMYHSGGFITTSATTTPEGSEFSMQSPTAHENQCL